MMVDFPIFFFLHQFSLPSSTLFPRINFPKTICLCENPKIRWFFLALHFRKEYHCDKKTNNIRRVFDIRQQQCIRFQRTADFQGLMLLFTIFSIVFKTSYFLFGFIFAFSLHRQREKRERPNLNLLKRVLTLTKFKIPFSANRKQLNIFSLINIFREI